LMTAEHFLFADNCNPRYLKVWTLCISTMDNIIHSYLHSVHSSVYSKAGKSASLLIRRTPVKRAV
jgi:hypothetical protein